MRRDLTIKTGSLAGTSDFRVLAPIKKGFVPALDAVTYKTRVKRVLRTLHIGRSGAHEHELARILSDAVERVGRIHSVGIAVLEPEDKVLLTVTFDGAWESYVRVIWQKVSRLLDLIFCNTEGYVLGYENSYEDWGAWLRSAQSEAAFLYATPDLTVDDIRYLRMQERVHRREAGDPAELRTTRIKIPSPEEIAARGIFEKDGVTGIDPTNAGFGVPLMIDDAGRPPFRHGVRSLVGLYRLADVYLPGTDDGVILHRAAHELLPEFVAMLNDGNTYKKGIKRASRRFDEAITWLWSDPKESEIRKGLPLGPPANPVLKDPADIQGGILRAYPDVDHGCLLLLQFASPAALAALLKAVPVTSAADPFDPGQIATNIAFTVEGFRLAGLTDDEIRRLPEEFVQGMERRAGLLGDVRINHPRRWRLPAANWHLGADAPDIGEGDPAPRIDLSAVHAIVQVRLRAGGSDAVPPKARLMAAMKDLVAAHPGVTPLSLQWMQRQRNPKGEVQEHFGFLDANSDPVLSKSEAGAIFPNHVHLGEILCGHPNVADKIGPYGDPKDPVAALLRDGSFLVVRKLRQDIEAFDNALAAAETRSSAAGQKVTRHEIMAKMMGRWPGAHPKAGMALVDPEVPSNDFTYKYDQHGSLCPFHAHIRRANPREEAESGGRPARIVRRGMSYGPSHDREGGDAKAVRASLDQERGLIFMAYNASLGEQFEVVQRWLSGGNSSGSYSGQSDPIVGLAEPGRRRYFRFEHGEDTLRIALDGSDRLHDEPRPFVRLEWGAYLFAPSRKAMELLQARAAAQGPALPWSVEDGVAAIGRLREIETLLGPSAGADAWKAALEDPDAAADFTTASIWAAIRARHGGVLRTPFGILVADRDMVEATLADTKNLTVTGYIPRMEQSFGVLYLGLDPQPGQAYERESTVCNAAIMALDRQTTFERARESTRVALQKLVDEAIEYATEDRETRWELTLDARELLEPLLADFCEAWFGLSTKDKYFERAGYRWDWDPTKPPNYPGHFLSPSRYIFQPRPGPDVETIGSAHGRAVRSAMINFLTHHGATIDAPVTRAVLDSPLGKADITFAARTIAGAMMGFIPTVEGNLRRILNEWLREGTLWKLRARFAGTNAADFADACNRLGRDFIPAMQLRAVPELIWRKATAAHTIGHGPHRVLVRPGEIVVAGAVSATQQNLEEGRADLYHAFGGNRNVAGHPTHACPGADPALAVMLGFFSALVDSPLPLRAGPGPLTLALDGRLPAREDTGLGTALALDWTAPTFDIITTGKAETLVKTQLAAAGDSWLFALTFLQFKWNSLVGALDRKGYAVSSFASPGRRLAEMAGSKLKEVQDHLANPGPTPPKALIIGGGGNDVTYEAPGKKAPLFNMLNPPGGEPLKGPAVDEFVDGELFGHYKKMIDGIIGLTSIPLLIHGYDHPVPDGRPFIYDGEPRDGPWLKPIFEQAGYDFKNNSEHPTLARNAMRLLIDRLNLMVERVAGSYPAGRVHHLKLTGTLAAWYGAPEKYQTGWSDELHATEPGFDELAGVIVKKLGDLGIT